MAIGNGELMHECFSKHSHIAKARIKYDKKNDKKGKMTGVSMEISKVVMKIKKSRKPITT